MGAVFFLFLVVCPLILLIWGLWAMFCYIMQSISYGRIVGRRGFEKTWYSWIPVARSWLLGSISDQYRYRIHGQNTGRRLKLMRTRIVELAVGVIGVLCLAIGIAVGLFVYEGKAGVNDSIAAVARELMGCSILFFTSGGIAGIIRKVCTYVATYDLYAAAKPKRAIPYLILSIVFPFLLPFFVFSCRNSDDGLYGNQYEM